ncbi:MAG: ABC transporter substrate-binding protein [Deltaproteobacteria bacterium]|nr:ABC transporter substrate-binding protein [Deltaproteobacteria bacterium]
MKSRSTLLVMVSLAAVVFLALAPATYAGQPGFDDKEIRIAQFSPQTGPAAPWGAVARGSGLLFDLVNEEGGIHGRTIKYYIRDSQYNPALAQAAVKEHVEKKGIFAFTGGVSGAGGQAVKDYLAKNKILWVVPGTAALNTVADREKVFPPSPYRFCSYPLFEDEASIVTKYAVEKLGYKKIGFLYQNDVFGKGGLTGCKQRLASYGMELVEAIPVEPTEKDLASQMLRLKNSGAECVLMWVSPTLSVITLKTCETIQYKPQWIAFDGLSDYQLMHNITGGLFEGVITAAFVPPPDSDDPRVAKYREVAKRLAPEERWGTFYLAGMLFSEPLVEALRKVGRNLSTEACIKELNTFRNWKGLGAPITWTENCHQGTDSVQIQKCGPEGTYILLQDWTANDLATWKKK